MEDINQDGNSEIAGNRVTVASGISQIKTTGKKKWKIYLEILSFYTGVT